VNAVCASSPAAPKATCSWSTCASKNITGKEAEAALGRAHITVNKNAIPNDPQKPFVTSGIRIGSPAMTTRGFTEIEAEQHRQSDRRRTRQAPNDEATTENVREQGCGAVPQVPGVWCVTTRSNSGKNAGALAHALPLLRRRQHAGHRHP
jgi:hypothetical protein